MPRIPPVGIRVGDHRIEPKVELYETEVLCWQFRETRGAVLPDDQGERVKLTTSGKYQSLVRIFARRA